MPALATVLINTYREANELFVDSSTLFSEKGITQGDALAFHYVCNGPLFNHLGNVEDLKQVWYADDALASGSLHSTRQWWNQIFTMGLALGYFANAAKTWLLTKEKFLDQAKTLFQGTQVNITTYGRPYLGAALGSKEFVDQFISDRVNSWEHELLFLSDIAKSHAATCRSCCFYTWVCAQVHIPM